MLQQEIFVYDRSLFAPASTSSALPCSLLAFPEPLHVDDPPDTLTDESSLDAWKQLFVQRREWARNIVKISSGYIGETLQHDEDIVVIIRATAIATERVSGNSGGLQSSIQEAQRWSVGVLQEPGAVLRHWDQTLKQLSTINVDPALLRFLRPPGESVDNLDAQDGDPTFHLLVPKLDANRAASRGKQAMKWLEGQLLELQQAYQSLTQDSSKLVIDFKKEQSNFDGRINDVIADLSEEMQAVVHKIDRDCDQVLNAQDGSRSLAAISKAALMHTQNLLPSLTETMADIEQLLHKTIERKNQAMELAVKYLQRVSAVESSFADVKAAVTKLEISDDDDRIALETLTFIHQLPLLYGSILVESVRRHEWTQNMSQESAVLADELAVYKDDEERRRRKWSKSLEHYLNPTLTDNKAEGINVNKTKSSSTWPETSRSDIHAYTGVLERVGGLDVAVQHVREATKSLNHPSKKQSRRSNAFKNGSIHEAALGRSGFLNRGDEMLQTLRSEKSRLEDRLKGSESRIRKLEDLLHRQSQISRQPGGSPRASIDRQPSTPAFPNVSLSPHGDTLQYRPSPASSRRVSQNNTAEEKAFVQRLLHLEGELEAERAKLAEAQTFAVEQRRAQEVLEQRHQEVTSIKQDLMANFEAQQSEFDDERRLLADQNRDLKIRVEELEEEIDRLSGSFDDRTALHERNHTLEIELQNLRSDASAEFETLQNHIKTLEDEQREKTLLLETRDYDYNEEKTRLQHEVSSLKEDLQLIRGERDEHLISLQAMHQDLAPASDLPLDFTDTVTAIDAVSRRAALHAKELQAALDSLKAENESISQRARVHEDEVKRLRQQNVNDDSERQKLQTDLAGQKGRFDALHNELEDKRAELRKLRARLSDGETGSEALRTRVSDEERKVEDLGQQIASSNSRVHELEELVLKLQNETTQFEAVAVAHEQLLRDKSERAEAISQLLFLQTDRLTRLLEHCGFSVTRQDEVMVIQRVSRSGTVGKESLLLGASQSIERTVSGPDSSSHPLDPPQYIHWALREDKEAEAEQFDAFHHESKAFDMEVFCDAIVKRIKDVEHNTRRWHREAKNYRDRFHRAQFDSQHKIAFRGFREGDLALFLPTRNQAPKRSWAAFNVGAPHYFLREEEGHRLSTRDWLLARISKVEERVVDLSKHAPQSSPSRLLAIPGSNAQQTIEDEENPFGLSDGLRWYYLDAAEEKVGAPSTPGMSKSTVASAHVDAAGSLSRKDKPDDTAVTRTLAKSLDSRRSSGNSRKSLVGAGVPTGTGPSAETGASGLRGAATSEEPARADGQIREDRPTGRSNTTVNDARADQLLGP